MAQPQTIMLSLNFVISILLHLNISSLLFQMDEFTNLLSALISNFKIIGITETRLTTKNDPVNSIE